jgi:lipopolysaccharide/colanic/teichoic acid biosynthesis glycosyltransferase
MSVRVPGRALAPVRVDWPAFDKRALDVVVAGAALLVLTPLLLVVAVVLRIEEPRCPALFRQRRAGRGGGSFVIFKFRTMVPGAEAMRADLVAASHDPHWLALAHDPRVTRLGRLLRRTCIDELPQFLNVLRGDMSLVGPRPLPLVEHERAPAWASVRLAVRPGMTGLWQVSGRTRLGFLDMLELDCRYARERSLRGDLRILLRTVPALLYGEGAN